MAACTTTTWVAKSKDVTYPAGVYLIQVLNKANEAATMVPDKQKSPFTQDVEGMPAAVWVDAQAKDGLLKLIAVRNKFAELGLEITPEDQQNIDMMTQIYWAYYGESYTNSGIAQTSLVMSNETEQMNQKIFDSIYGEGGTKEIPKDELKKFYDENFISISSYEIPLQKAEGDKTVPDEQAKALAEDALKRIQDGEDFYKVVAELETKLVKDDKDKHEHKEGGREHDSLIDLTLTGADAKMPKAIVDEVKAAEIGGIVKQETAEKFTIIKKNDTVNDTVFFENQIATIRALIKGEEYDAQVKEWAKAVEADVKFNKKSLKRYSAENMFETK